MSERVAVERKSASGALRGLVGLGRRIFLASGILPLVLIVAIVGFALAQPRFLTYQILFNVARASSFLVIVSMGQMLTLLVRGVDMSIGSTEALVSVCVAVGHGDCSCLRPRRAMAGDRCGHRSRDSPLARWSGRSTALASPSSMSALSS